MTHRGFLGDIIYARLLSNPVVVVNSEEVAKDLFELRSAIYSDRPESIIVEPWAYTSSRSLNTDHGDIVSFALEFNAAFIAYGDRYAMHACAILVYTSCSAGGVFIDEFSTSHIVKVLYLPITLTFVEARIKC